MKKYRNIALAMVIILTTLILSTCGYYNYMLKPVSKDTKIKEITIPAGSSTTEIANILNIKQSSYSNKELGRRAFTVEEIKLLKELFEVTYEDLLN